MAKNLQTVARRALTPCAGSDAFRFADGTMVRDLNEFRHAIATKSASLVHHHREAYAHWIHDVLGDPALARKVERVSHKRALDNLGYQAELLAVLDERLGKLKLRVL
ncbi:MAG TPA: hypothetical protein VM582_05030 [Candidatus Thermoplasmatota archaeon]|nr:hypothetical protein [Candidatus Thermoplasmatota archaeon]